MNAKKIEQIENLIDRRKLKDAEKKLNALAKGRPFTAAMNYLAYRMERQRGRIDLAHRYIALANKQEPQNLTYIGALGTTYLKAQQYKPAEGYFAQCISAEPDNASHWFNYGTAMQFQDRYDEADRAYRKAIELDPNHKKAYLSLAQLLQYLRRHKEASDLLTKAHRLFPQAADIACLNGQIQQELGMTAEAKESFLLAYQLEPKNLESLYYLSTFDVNSLPENAIDQIQNQTFRTTKDQLSRAFILAAHSRKNRQFHEELAYLEQGHELFRKNLANAEVRRSNTLNKTVNVPNASLNITFSEEHRRTELYPIFIVGCPRSGSTLLESLLATSPSDPISLEECGVFTYAASTRLLESFNPDSSSTIEIDNAFAKLIHKTYQEKGLPAGTPRFTDKSLDNVFYVEIILALFPNAKFLYCNRHPLASLVSILQNNLAGLAWAHDVPAILAYIDATRRAGKQWLEKYPTQFMSFNYEEFVLNHETASAPIFDFCALEWGPERLAELGKRQLSQTASNVQIRQGINTKGLDRYKNYAAFFQEYSEQYPWLSEH